MKRIGLLLGLLAAMFILLPLTAQDAKKDKEKTEKKDGEKKEPDKKEEKKKPEKLIYGVKFVTKIVSMKGESNREYTIEVQEVDQKKVYDMNVWGNTRTQQLAQQYNAVFQQKDGNARMQQLQAWMRDSQTFQFELAKRKTQVYTAKNIDVRAADTAKVRAMVPPIEFDDQGFQKKWTKKELEERKDKTGLPGYPVDFDSIKAGQFVEIYMAKVAPTKKEDLKKKKGPDDDDAPGAMKDKGKEFVLIVIMQDAK